MALHIGNLRLGVDDEALWATLSGCAAFVQPQFTTDCCGNLAALAVAASLRATLHPT